MQKPLIVAAPCKVAAHNRTGRPFSLLTGRRADRFGCSLQRAAASRLQQDYSQLSGTFEAETAAWQSRCQALQAETDQAAAEGTRLLQELAQRPTHQQVSRQ